MNDDLIRLQDTLIREHKRLRERLRTLRDAEKIDAVVREMTEMNHRVQLVGGLLFAAGSEELGAKVALVSKSTRKLAAALKDLKDLSAFLDAAKGFLVLVDEAIDFAKTV